MSITRKIQTEKKKTKNEKEDKRNKEGKKKTKEGRNERKTMKQKRKKEQKGQHIQMARQYTFQFRGKKCYPFSITFQVVASLSLSSPEKNKNVATFDDDKLQY